MEFLLEFIFGIYVELMMCIVPEEKATSKKYRAVAALIAAAVLLGTLALFIWGAILINDYNNSSGIIPIIIAIVISIIQIIAGIILNAKKSRSRK